MLLESRRLALSGRADIVESNRQPFPVEYKRGKRKPNDCDLVQLCAQALCLEEMLQTDVPAGDIFYGEPRRRMGIPFSQQLRARTEELARQMHQLYRNRITPAPISGPHCRNCSLNRLCLLRQPATPLSKTAGA